MASEFVAILGPLGGAVIGGLIAYFVTRSAKHHEWTLTLARDRIASRQKLYADFLVESQRLVTQAMEEKISSISALDGLNGKFAEISLVSPVAVVQAARDLLDHILISHTIGEAKLAGDFFNLRQTFIDEARKEIVSIETQV